MDWGSAKGDGQLGEVSCQVLRVLRGRLTCILELRVIWRATLPTALAASLPALPKKSALFAVIFRVLAS